MLLWSGLHHIWHCLQLCNWSHKDGFRFDEDQVSKIGVLFQLFFQLLNLVIQFINCNFEGTVAYRLKSLECFNCREQIDSWALEFLKITYLNEIKESQSLQELIGLFDDCLLETWLSFFDFFTVRLRLPFLSLILVVELRDIEQLFDSDAGILLYLFHWMPFSAVSANLGRMSTKIFSLMVWG